MLSRRSFLRSTVQGSTLVAMAPMVPGFLAQTARDTQPERDGQLLVVVQLDGGNDGINTVVPFADEGYPKYRRHLRLPADRLIKVTREVGLHPSLRDAAKLLETGRLAVVQGVGYPNPSRSHFKSMAIWHTGNADLPRGGGDFEDEETRAGLGWIGRALDGQGKPADGAPSATYVGVNELPRALRGRRSVPSTLTRLEDSVLIRKPDAKLNVTAPEPGEALAAFVSRRTLDAYATSERITEVLQTRDGGAAYPATALADRLRLVARLIKGGIGTRIFYTTQSGYDTHARQLPAHAELLAEFGGAVRAFMDDLAAARLGERVVLMAFSEFGRRVQENGNMGTDHGTAGPVFLAGAGVKAGLVGEAPRLLDLEDGDLKMKVDFRRVYASVLEDWLRLPAKASLGAAFERLPLIRTGSSPVR
jgi:uncharacterized protein (DUF1501 family)